MYSNDRSLPIGIEEDPESEEVCDSSFSFVRNYEQLDVKANNPYNSLAQSVQEMHLHRIAQLNEDFEKIHTVMTQRNEQLLENSRQRRKALLQEYEQQRLDLLKELEQDVANK